jgi:hypothetical protein
MLRVDRTFVAAILTAVVVATTAPLGAQGRGDAQGRGGVPGRGAGGAQRGQTPPGRGGISPREIQAQFDAYLVAQAEAALQVSEEQYPQFVRRVRALQHVRRQARIERTRLISRLNVALRAELRGREGARATADDAALATAIREIDDHESVTLAEVKKAYASLDEVLTPWQRARFRVLEDQLEQKKVDMMMRARQPIRR